MSELPDLRDILTDDGRELPRTILPPHLQAVVDRAMFRADRMVNPMRCTCGHTIADHTPVTDEWLIGARTVTETREQCAKCDCDDFEEDPND